jgi:hypothetical protein
MRVPAWISVPGPSLAVGDDGVDGGVTAGPGADRDGVAVADGATGNTRLTAATGMVLLVLLAIEGVTILSVRQMLTLHVVVGALLVGPVLLKSGSTLYRFARYYTKAHPYRRQGPPPAPLRVIGPLVILSTLALLGTGVALILVGPTGSGLLLTAHQAAFWVWFGLMSVHVLGHVIEAAVLSWRDLRASWTGPDARWRRWRMVAVVLALMVGVGAAAALVPSAGTWTTARPVRPAAHAAPTAAVQP